MIGRLAALILLSTLSQTNAIPHQISMTVAGRGDNVTIMCPVSMDRAGLFYLYKLKFGYMVQTVASGTFETVTLQGEFTNSRFTVTKGNNLYHLNIANVSKEDEATYFCQDGSAYTMKVSNGTLLTVNDHKNLQKSGKVTQSPETASVQLGDSVTLQCSLLFKYRETREQCPDVHSVYWFRAGSVESLPGVVYTDRNSIDGRSCVYSLSKAIRNSSDAGTYYCAVVTCGEILFGDGTKVEPRQELLPSVILLGILLAFCLILNAVLCVSRNQKPICKHCKGEVTASNHGEHDRSAEYADGEEATINYVALDFPSRKAQRWVQSRELAEECLYSGTSQ